MKTEEKIRVLIIHNPTGSEPNECYRLDDKESAEHCFDHFMNNFDSGEKIIISVKDMTPDEWAECERAGEEFS